MSVPMTEIVANDAILRILDKHLLIHLLLHMEHDDCEGRDLQIFIIKITAPKQRRFQVTHILHFVDGYVVLSSHVRCELLHVLLPHRLLF